TYWFVLLIWSACYFTYQYFQRSNKALKQEAAMTEIELNNLKSQLNPHFIFNALNSIRALVDEDPAKSKNAITQLSNILRNSLASDKKRLITFKDELKTVEDYLSLESIRYEERLQTEFDIHPDSYKFLVPPLMIQTLVENSIKHGIAKLKKGGVVQLKTQTGNYSLRVQLRNTGHFEVNGKNGADHYGLGLKNTRQRLNLIYGNEASFKIENETEDIVLTELIIPLTTEI
ncbi:MAG: histidine kinase, partial [Bacteroidota bacterium]